MQALSRDDKVNIFFPPTLPFVVLGIVVGIEPGVCRVKQESKSFMFEKILRLGQAQLQTLVIECASPPPAGEGSGAWRAGLVHLRRGSQMG